MATPLPSHVYEGTFLVAVATSYFLALNGLAGYLFLRMAGFGQQLRDVQREIDGVRPHLREQARFSALMMRSVGEDVKSRQEPSHPHGAPHE
jgi:hypothetical protein